MTKCEEEGKSSDFLRFLSLSPAYLPSQSCINWSHLLRVIDNALNFNLCIFKSWFHCRSFIPFPGSFVHTGCFQVLNMNIFILSLQFNLLFPTTNLVFENLYVVHHISPIIIRLFFAPECRERCSNRLILQKFHWCDFRTRLSRYQFLCLVRLPSAGDEYEN